MVTVACKDLEVALQDALKENENMLIRLKIKHGTGQSDQELQKLRDKTQQEYIDTIMNTLKIEVMNEVKKIAREGGGGATVVKQ